MVLLGFAWFNSTLVNADSALVFTWAATTGGLWGGLFLHLGISFPSGRIESRGDRALVIAGYVIFPLAFVSDAVVQRRRPAQPAADRARRWAQRPDARVGALFYATLFILVVVRSATATGAPRRFERLQLTPVYTFALLTFALVTIAQVGRRRSGLVGRRSSPRADAVRVHRRADALRISHLDAELHERWRSCAPRGPARAGRRRGPAQAGARPARRRAVAAGGAGVDAAGGAQPRWRRR